MPKGVKVDKTGNWKAVLRKLKLTQTGVPNNIRKHSERFAIVIRDRVRKAILTNGASVGQSWPANTQRVENLKGFNQPLLWSGQYYNAINVQATKQRRRGVYGTGTRGGVFEWDIAPDQTTHVHARNGRTIPMAKLALFMENGATTKFGRIPARPHWRPAGAWANMHMHRYIKSKYLQSRFLERIWK